MARKGQDDWDEPAIDSADDAPASGSEKPGRRAKRPAPRSARPYLRYVWTVFLFVAAAGCLLAVADRLDNFLATEPRFILPPGEDGETVSPNLQVSGAVHASPQRIRDVFARDVGHSLYLLPIHARQRQIASVDWVRNASVSRVWPNSVWVSVEERTPAAFVQLPVPGRRGSFRMALIDDEGVIMETPTRARFSLPVLTGLREDTGRTPRRLRVRQALHMLGELSDLGKPISEIDVTDAENLVVTRQMDDTAVMLMMGHQNYVGRMQNFLNHYPEMHGMRPNARVFDLRLDRRITAVEGMPNGH